ncbi:MAG TPA: NADH-ubiquinone oxidoreductase-F iron-sulfur binding region domain-containing protein, partial [Acidimicrobiales bacterium]
SAPSILDRVRVAAAELVAADWAPGVSIDVVAGPGAYLYGEETALLEVLEGREPFPRIAPPWRRGIDDLGDDSALAGEIQLAGPGDDSESPPALVNNVETMANIPAIVSKGPEWFRTIGSDRSPGSLVVTVTGRTRRAGVAEVAMGTPLREVIAEVGGGARIGRVVAVLPGVSSAALSGDQLDVPLTYEAVAAAGSGLGAGSFYVLDDASDPVAVAQGVSRFLAVESCGQCSPCKQDGKAVSVSLDRLRRSDPGPRDLDDIASRLDTIARGARCSLATQHQVVVQSLIALFPRAFQDHASRALAPSDPVLIAEVVDLVGTQLVLDEAHAGKQPDWTFAAQDSGASPAERLNQLAGEG